MIEDYRDRISINTGIDLQEWMSCLDTFRSTRNERMVVRGLKNVGGAEMKDVGNRAWFHRMEGSDLSSHYANTQNV